MRGKLAFAGGAVVGAVTTLWLTASSMRRQPQQWAEMILDDEPRLYVGKLRANLEPRDPHENVDEGHVFTSDDLSDGESE